MGRKVGVTAELLLRGSWVPSNTMSPGPRPTCIKWYLDPSSRLATTDMGRKFGCCALLAGAGSPSNTIWPGPMYTSMPSDILNHPTVWPQYTNATDRRNRTGQTTVRWHRANRSRFRLGFGLRLAQEACIGWDAHWRHPANTTQLSMCRGDATFCEVTLATCFFIITTTTTTTTTTTEKFMNVEGIGINREAAGSRKGSYYQ